MPRAIIDVPLDDIAPRRVSRAKVEEFVRLMQEGRIFPPVKLSRLPEGSPYRWRISDGGHRVAAARALGRRTIKAKVWLTDEELEAIMAHGQRPP
ncbi:MAG: ParB N-terminal domain-containing protein [Dehalococcoidia bacterium]|jgi:ParB-like chromosome segregation protein Spo0J|nr:ParB N-terminal domain-containing protein [Dehalococcoidia bacterium]MDW8009784.1 ParB N-terminal domain-containing protein [Chloroflexota bacterium]